MNKLPWKRSEYTKLTDSDFLSPPTPERRIRIAAALATDMRDRAMLGFDPCGNFETLRGVLTMGEREWERDVVPLKDELLREGLGFDTVDPKQRYLQCVD